MYPNAHDNKCLLNQKSQMNSQPFGYKGYINTDIKSLV